ncbi:MULTISPECIES: hypothetical protein [Comamonas]|uniref:Uncharacterized protein n=1 Tax=Comamonas thiooxydans TaxID=363952 RepID=A0A0E3BUQ9_9BURK|nr:MULTISPECIES: hypothetical protein [Comamonas]KGH08735.1 hypothetical protein P608_17630 [Comamonas thiooxydans]KGH16342.1 hypothetical protein P607_20435 [Comamonas thiooxydans]KGH20491.1 hypothetical protein P606_21140 [Comamonas thiooxydans]KKI12120.1 hypothetical protein XA67_21405 [Comamonas thiooxydans]
MIRRNWNRFRASNFLEAVRACKDFGLERHGRTVARIADHAGATEDTMYKWIATGRIPGILIPTYEMACGAHFISDWLATSAGRMVIPMPTGRKATEAELLQISEDCAASMRKLAAFYADPSKADTTELMELLQRHLEQVAFHHHNVGRYQTPELEFGA